MTEVRPLAPAEALGRLDELCALLRDAVEDGASIGFLAPLAGAEAEAYWEGVVEALAGGRCVLLAALAGGCVVGAVQLGLEARANGRHRAELMKLMVLRAQRRRGIGRALMGAALAEADRLGRSLLLLDVRAGDPAEALYRSLGFVPIGRVPRSARSPGGSLAATCFYYLERG